jgi:hypothetical protein
VVASPLPVRLVPLMPLMPLMPFVPLPLLSPFLMKDAEAPDCLSDA